MYINIYKYIIFSQPTKSSIFTYMIYINTYIYTDVCTYVLKYVSIMYLCMNESIFVLIGTCTNALCYFVCLIVLLCMSDCIIVYV